jgi:hypothetical protein
LNFSIDGTSSLNLGQPRIVDLNFRENTYFTLFDEKNRPIYVSDAAISPITGALLPTESRLFAEYSHTRELRSDARSVSKRLTVTVSPDLPFSRYAIRGSYSLGAVRAQQDGLTFSTTAGPNLLYWAAGPNDVRHQLQMHSAYNSKSYALSIFALFESGRPYTPIVGSDINGDGYVNDRAFIFHSDTKDADSSSEGIANVIKMAPGRVRSCLMRQVGQFAAPSSCRGPWSQLLNLQLVVRPRWSPTTHSTLRRSVITVSALNVLGGLDQLLHDSKSLRGWGPYQIPDPVLLRVRGFNLQSRQFIYDVNGRFGDTHLSKSLIRAPFKIVLDVSFDLAKPLGLQQVEKWIGKGQRAPSSSRLSVDSLSKLYSRNIPDPFNPILMESDSLLLSQLQADSIREIRRQYRMEVDSLWDALATKMFLLPNRFDVMSAYVLQEEMTDRAWSVAWTNVQKLKSILTGIQQTMLPYPASMLIKGKKPPKGIRFYLN